MTTAKAAVAEFYYKKGHDLELAGSTPMPRRSTRRALQESPSDAVTLYTQAALAI